MAGRHRHGESCCRRRRRANPRSATGASIASGAPSTRRSRSVRRSRFRRWVSTRRPRPISSSSSRNGSAPNSNRSWCSSIRQSTSWPAISPAGRAPRVTALAEQPSAAVRFGSLAELLRHRAAVQPDERAYVALSDRGGEEASITFAGLARRSAALAQRIAAHAAPGERVLLLCPNGIGFMVGFFGCVLAGVIAVPMMLPRRQNARDASASIVADCAPRLALAPRGLIAGERGDLVGRFAGAGLVWLAVDEGSEA